MKKSNALIITTAALLVATVATHSKVFAVLLLGAGVAIIADIITQLKNIKQN